MISCKFFCTPSSPRLNIMAQLDRCVCEPIECAICDRYGIPPPDEQSTEEPRECVFANIADLSSNCTAAEHLCLCRFLGHLIQLCKSEERHDCVCLTQGIDRCRRIDNNGHDCSCHLGHVENCMASGNSHHYCVCLIGCLDECRAMRGYHECVCMIGENPETCKATVHAS